MDVSTFPYLEMISRSYRQQLEEIYARYKDLIDTIPASVKQHHNWTGGYKEHVLQVMGFAIRIFATVKDWAGYTLDDVLVVAFIHDLDKLFRYRKLDVPKDGREWDYSKDYKVYDESAKVAVMCAEHGLLLSDKQLEALAMHHGGWSDKAQSGRANMTSLAAVIHSADILSTFVTNKKGTVVCGRGQ